MKKRTKIIIGILIFLSLLFFTYHFPYSGDDWAFATSYGSAQLKELFRNLNGRYLGNILIIIISRNNIVKTLFMSTIIFSIIYFSTKIIKKDNIILMMIFYIIFLTMYFKIFSQSIIWSSGFCNYATSTLVLVLILYLCLNQKRFKGSVIVYFLLSFLGSLFVENVTIAIFLFSVILNIYYFIRKKEINYNYLALLLGSLLGTLIMFLNPSYLKLINDTDRYRELKSANLRKDMFPFMFINQVLNILKIIVILKIIFNSKEISKIVIGYILIMLILVLAGIGYFKQDLVLYVLIALYFLLGAIFLFLNRKKLDNNCKMVLLIFLLTIFPLFFVSPIGARNFLAIYVLQAIFYLNLLCILKVKLDYHWLFYALSNFIIYLFIFNIYNTDFKITNNMRDEMINQVNNGKNIICIDTNIFSDDKVHYPLPYQKEDKVSFSEFYHIKKDWDIKEGIGPACIKYEK